VAHPLSDGRLRTCARPEMRWAGPSSHREAACARAPPISLKSLGSLRARGAPDGGAAASRTGRAPDRGGVFCPPSALAMLRCAASTTTPPRRSTAAKLDQRHPLLSVAGLPARHTYWNPLPSLAWALYGHRTSAPMISGRATARFFAFLSHWASPDAGALVRKAHPVCVDGVFIASLLRPVLSPYPALVLQFRSLTRP
jgi:hypothetical protein